MTEKLTDAACKNIIISLARKLGINPRLVTTRLMSDEDKNDMRNGDVPIKMLELYLKLWIEEGLPNHREGKTVPLAQE